MIDSSPPSSPQALGNHPFLFLGGIKTIYEKAVLQRPAAEELAWGAWCHPLDMDIMEGAREAGSCFFILISVRKCLLRNM